MHTHLQCSMGASSLALVVVVAAIGCQAGRAAQTVEPVAPNGREALGESSCPNKDQRIAPLIVDWPQEQRGEVQAEMTEGLAVVAYDCKAIRVLPDCHVEGLYGYVGLPRDEQAVQIRSADELSANLPRTAAIVGVQVDAELARGASIDLALVMVGRRRTTRMHAARADLKGECAGATHFVRGAIIGAFAMDTGTQAKVRTTAEVFGAAASGASTSSHVKHSSQGTLSACAAAHAGDPAPPPGCEAAYRIELAAIDAAGSAASTTASSTPNDKLVSECPPGMVLTGGKCAKPNAETVHVCDPNSYADCDAQCRRGEMKSCFAVGWMYENGSGAEKDLAKAMVLYKMACDGGGAEGCRGLGWMYSQGIGAPTDAARAMDLYKLGCDRGDASSCSNLGFMYGTAKAGAPDYARAFTLSKQGCDGGDPNGCNSLGILHENGWGLAADLARAAVFYRQACDGGSPIGCSNMGSLLVTGRGVPVDRARGIELLRRGCAAGNTWGCEKLRSYGETR